ncbi:rhomboid family intramembrane serine protease [Micromonospora humi]|uniref:Rhomboid family protein n=1 Tax=Micromonospora humi TaxID=745366 RepID=A0A1C5IUG6_9ACTN|nr:rhomboid family intramembrane serine protease [Micromonospora humi]SCG61970.1 Rhomboid family protein [Micromonospora humi]
MTALAYLVPLATAVRAGVGLVAARGSDVRRRVPVATVAALVVVGVPTLLQLTVAPALLGQLGRDRAAIGDGQVWRLVTSLVVQDGGVAGSVFNLAALAVVGVVAERVWGAGRWAVVALASGVLAQVWGLVVQPVGAGNSVAVFGLAASVAVVAVRSGDRVGRLLGVASLLVAVALLVAGDIHGGAAVVGAAVGTVLTATDRRSRR